jgi:hypothetical protein
MSKSPPGRWKRISRTSALELVIHGTWTAGIAKAGPRAYVWTLFGAGENRTGTATSEYAAQRAVRKAIREAQQ